MTRSNRTALSHSGNRRNRAQGAFSFVLNSYKTASMIVQVISVGLQSSSG